MEKFIKLNPRELAHTKANYLNINRWKKATTTEIKQSRRRQRINKIIVLSGIALCVQVFAVDSFLLHNVKYPESKNNMSRIFFFFRRELLLTS